MLGAVPFSQCTEFLYEVSPQAVWLSVRLMPIHWINAGTAGRYAANQTIIAPNSARSTPAAWLIHDQKARRIMPGAIPELLVVS